LANLGKLLFEIAIKDSTKQGSNSVLQNNKKLIKDLQFQMKQASLNSAMLQKTRIEQQIIRKSEKLETLKQKNVGENLNNLKFQDKLLKQEIGLSRKRETLIRQNMNIAKGGNIEDTSTTSTGESAAMSAGKKAAVAAIVIGAVIGAVKMAYNVAKAKHDEFTSAAQEQLPYVQHLGRGPNATSGYWSLEKQANMGNDPVKENAAYVQSYDIAELDKARDKGESYNPGVVGAINSKNEDIKFFKQFNKIKTANGFYGGIDYGNNNGITGTQQAALASLYARSGNTMNVNQFANGNAGRTINSWGFNPETVAGTGMLSRFGGGSATKQLYSLLGGAVQSGNEANADKFIQKFEDAVYQGVMDGSQVSNTDLLQLFTGMMSGNQRFRELTPGVIKGMQSLNTNTMNLEGGAGESLLMTSVMRATGNSNVWDARDFIANNPVQAQQMRLKYMRNNIKDPRALAYAFSKDLGGGGFSSENQAQIVNAFDNFKGGNQAEFMQNLENKGAGRTAQREGNLANQNLTTSYQDFMQNLFSLSTASESCAKIINTLTNAVGVLVNGIVPNTIENSLKKFNVGDSGFMK
jgi:hypothetical protein